MKKRGDFLRNKNAQTTMFVIIGLLLVVVISILFFLYNGEISLPIGKTSLPAPETYIQSCVSDAVLEVSDKIIKTGGYYEPKGEIFYALHDGNEVPFLCYTRNYYESCIMQQPALKQHVENEIENNIKEKVITCYNRLKTEYERTGYAVSFPDRNNPQIALKLNPGIIDAEIKNNLVLEKGEETLRFELIKSKTSHPIYELVGIALQILDCEKNDYCDAPAWATGYSLYHPSKQFNFFSLTNETEGLYGARIYEINDRQTNKKFVFGVRGGVWPAGFL